MKIAVVEIHRVDRLAGILADETRFVLIFPLELGSRPCPERCRDRSNEESVCGTLVGDVRFSLRDSEFFEFGRVGGRSEAERVAERISFETKRERFLVVSQDGCDVSVAHGALTVPRLPDGYRLTPVEDASKAPNAFADGIRGVEAAHHRHAVREAAGIYFVVAADVDKSETAVPTRCFRRRLIRQFPLRDVAERTIASGPLAMFAWLGSHLTESVLGTMTTYLVTRHRGAVEWVSSRGHTADVIVGHFDPAGIRPGDVVIGTLPVNLAAGVCARGGRYLNLSVTVPAALRGIELSADQLDEFGATIEEYEVHWCCVEDPTRTEPTED